MQSPSLCKALSDVDEQASRSERGAAAAMMYLVAYLPTVLGIFFCLCVATSMTRSSSVGSLTGLNRRSPLLAFGFCVALMSLAGVPPFAGFFGKLTVLINGKAVGEAPGHLLPSRPFDGLSVGNDTESLVADYTAPTKLKGPLEDIRIYWGVLDAKGMKAWASK